MAEDGKSITVYFSKNVEGKNRAFYTINDENNKPVYIRNIEGSGREYKIVLNNPLPIGTNTIKIQDVYDTTVLKNKIEPYVEQIYMKDVEKPVITSYSGNGRDIVIIFSKEMDAYTVENPENYILKINNERIYMPRDTEFIPLANNSKSWRIVLPEKINNKIVDIGKSGNIREIDILSIKALNGIPVDPQTLHFTDVNQGEAKIEEAILTSPDIIEVKFNLPIYYASYNDFIVKDRKINDVRLDGGNIVQILLEDDGKTTSSGNLTVVNNNNIETALGTNAKSQTIEVVDQVPPRILPDINELSMYGNTIELPFTEKLYGDLAHLFKEDLIVESLDYGVLDKNEYSTSLNRDGNIIIIRILNNKNNYYGYRIRLVDRPGIIRDLNSNVIEPDNWEYYTK